MLSHSGDDDVDSDGNGGGGTMRRLARSTGTTTPRRLRQTPARGHSNDDDDCDDSVSVGAKVRHQPPATTTAAAVTTTKTIKTTTLKTSGPRSRQRHPQDKSDESLLPPYFIVHSSKSNHDFMPATLKQHVRASGETMPSQWTSTPAYHVYWQPPNDETMLAEWSKTQQKQGTRAT